MSDSDKLRDVSELLFQAEGLLARALNGVREEHVAEMASLLRTLVAVRMRMEVPSAEDNRTAARIFERAVVEIACDNGTRSEGALHDISTGGALVECDPPILRGTRCKMTVSGSAEPISATACATHQGVTHLAFDKMPPAQLVGLAKHIERYFVRY